MVLQQKIAERTKLLSQLEQAKMQEQVSASLRSMTEIAAPGNTPSLDEVFDALAMGKQGVLALLGQRVSGDQNKADKDGHSGK